MQSLKVLAISLIAVLATGCHCRTAGGPENVPSPNADGPLKDIHFAFDSSKLNGTAKSTLQANADWLKMNAGKKVQVEGHCDERGTAEYNMVLGASRARAGADHLRSLGIPDSDVSTVSYGEELPLDPAHNEAAWSQNRRDHFKVD